MKRLMTTIACLSILFVSASCVTYRTCSSEEMVKMKEGGFSVEDINRACTSSKISDEVIDATRTIIQGELDRRHQNGNRPAADGDQTSYRPAPLTSVAATSVATTCVTQRGVCPLIQPGVRGAPCVCHSWYGQFPGDMR